jgi:hypothetical protein
VSTLDLSNPAHREALRWACSAKEQSAYGGWSPLQYDALRALSSPEQSASIVRVLLEGCGVPADVEPRGIRPHGPHRLRGNTYTEEHVQISVDWQAHGIVRADGCTWGTWDYDVADLPALILALLAAKNRDGAIAALREAGR